MNKVNYLFLLVLGVSVTGCGMRGPAVPLEVVEYVDIERYMGKWYEIARYPTFFQGADCVATTAEYSLRDDGKVRVVNACREGGLDGPEDSIEGVARVVDSVTNAKLKVRFFGPFEGDYWIIDLDPDYQWAVVGAPSRDFLWILSRTPTMDEDLYTDIVSRLPEKLYDPEKLLTTLQPSP
ncbi:MAG TPA: lipocalin family protein [Phycisphaerae bacterium]|nr:lipocalin family protein [Phycisphaerae bacterium]HNU44873.1 lipocalin family protein [Phycisphaerae bacterium]